MRYFICCFWLLLCICLVGLSASEVLAQEKRAEFSYEIGYIAYVSSGGDLREVIPISDGSVLVGGHTSSTELPTTEGVIQPDYAGDDPALGHPGIYGGDCYLVRLSRDGKEVLAATYFGGSKQERSIYGMALDKQGNIIITSATRSPDIPTTAGCFQPRYGGGDSDWFVAKLSPDFREVLWCTYVGGSKGKSPRGGLALDEQDNVYVVGGTSSSDFPTTPDSFQPERNGTQDSALIKLEPDGTKLVYSTLIGGSGKDPTTFPGFGELVDEKICKKIHISFDYSIGNFDYPPGAKASIFGTWTGIFSNARDLARISYLWLNNGKWRGDQVIPQDWLEQAIHVALDILENCPEEEWIYGHGFWTNEYGQMWPDLPRDSYAALGGNSSHIIWVCPSLDLVVVGSPSIWSSDDASEGLRKLIVEAYGK